jgi:hypothetical protein
LETNRIYHAAVGWLVITLLAASSAMAQQTASGDSPNLPADRGRSDTIGVMPLLPPSDTSASGADTLTKKVAPDTSSNQSFAAPESTIQAPTGLLEKITSPSIYVNRTYLSTGPADEIKGSPDIFMISPGPIGSPTIPVDYLNVSAANVTLNGLPFPYSGLYRPYVIGTDLNAIPWEIMQDIHYGPNNINDGLDIVAGRPHDDVNRSDVEVSRGPYGYKSSRWRFFRPFGKKTYVYFTVGFKNAQGYLENSDYNGYHVTGGIQRKIGNGLLSLDLWKHIVKAGLNSFDFIPTQESRQERGIYRYEVRYNRPLRQHITLDIAGFYHRSDQIISGYGNEVSSKYDIGGGQAHISDTLGQNILKTGLNYYRIQLFGLLGKNPRVNNIEYSAGISGARDKAHYEIDLSYNWNEKDMGALLPKAKLSYGCSPNFSPFISISRFRRLPDLYLLNFDDNITGLNSGLFLESYSFAANPKLKSPVTTDATVGVESHSGKLESSLGASFKRINSQIYLNYSIDSLGNNLETPINFDDSYLEIFGAGKYSVGPISGEASGSFRKWNKGFFADGLEKGPVALGFARLSILKGLFVPRLYFGGSLEARFSSRRDYRSITEGLTNGFAALSGWLEFRYEDFTFWLNEDNLTNATYITWWDYYQAPRTVWWGFRWAFLD